MNVANQSSTTVPTGSVFLCFFCERSFTDKNVLQLHQETCDLRSLGLESLFAAPPPPRPKFDRAEKRSHLENLGLLPTWLVELQLSQRRTDVVCDVIVVDDSDDDDVTGNDDDGDAVPVRPPRSASPVRYSHHRGGGGAGKRRRCPAKDDAAAKASRNATKLLKIDVCSPLGQRLRACIGSTATPVVVEQQNLDGRSRCGRQPLTDNAGILNVDSNDVALLLRSRTVFFRDKFPVTYRPNRGNPAPHGSNFCHAYRFTKWDRKEFCRLFDSGLNARSRRLMRSVRPCRVAMRRLPGDKVESGDAASTPVRCSPEERGQVCTMLDVSAIPVDRSTAAAQLGAGDTEPCMVVRQTASVRLERAAEPVETMAEAEVAHLTTPSVADSKSSLSFYCDVCKRVLDFLNASTLNIYRHFASHGITDLELQETRLDTGETVLNLVEVIRGSDSEKEAAPSPVNCDGTPQISAAVSGLVLEAPSPPRGGILSNGNGRLRSNASSGRRVRWADQVEDPTTGSAHRISEIIPHVEREEDCGSQEFVTLDVDSDDGDDEDEDCSLLETDPTTQKQQLPVVVSDSSENIDVIVVGDDSSGSVFSAADCDARLSVLDAVCRANCASLQYHSVCAADPFPSAAAAAAAPCRVSDAAVAADQYAAASPTRPTSHATEPNLPSIIPGPPRGSLFHGQNFAFRGTGYPTTSSATNSPSTSDLELEDLSADFPPISMSRSHNISQSEIICVD